jgi:hypothetical protein
MAKNNTDKGITLAKNLRAVAKKSSLRKIASEAGIPQSSLSSWSLGQLPSGAAGHQNLRKLCNYLNCSSEILMFGDISLPLQENPFSLQNFIKGDVFSGKFLVDIKIKKLPED